VSRLLFRLAAVAAFVSPASHAAAADETSVNVERRGPQIVVDVNMHVPAPLANTWGAWTDFEQMPGYLPTLKHSKIMRREGNQLEVAQRTETKVLLVPFTVNTLRRVDLVPMQEIRTQLLSGDFKSYTSSTKFTDKGDRTQVVYHGEYVPMTNVPLVMSASMVESHTRRHFQLLGAEAQRRHAMAAAPK
jgi:ribosome-associated toxin RatA of RatAB toxin-antitoxin module